MDILKVTKSRKLYSALPLDVGPFGEERVELLQPVDRLDVTEAHGVAVVAQVVDRFSRSSKEEERENVPRQLQATARVDTDILARTN
jgi:hypothetical protein